MGKHGNVYERVERDLYPTPHWVVAALGEHVDLRALGVWEPPATKRPRFFRDCPHFVGKIVLTKRVLWFKNPDPKKERPKENTAWFLWERSPLRARRPPIILYAPATDHGSAR